MDKQKLKSELLEHLPFTIFGVSISIIVLVIFQNTAAGGKTADIEGVENVFHIFHPLHLLFSGMTSTALAYRISQNALRAISISFLTTLTFCTFSDVFLPFLGGILASAPMHLHICALEEPFLIFSFLAFGIFTGIVSGKKVGKISYFSHATHVLISSMASLFYLVGYGLENWIRTLGPVFLITFLAVIIPCCLSDIVFPVAFTHAEHEHPHT